jgi:hypothetical protein
MEITGDPNINCAPTVFPVICERGKTCKERETGFLEENTGSQLLRGISLNDPKQH